MPSIVRTAGRLLAAVAPVLAALSVWAPIRKNYFYGDDFLHLFDLVTLGYERFVLQLWGGHLYLLRNTFLTGVFQAFGPDPRPFFLIILAVHAANTFLLQRVLVRLTRDHLLATFGALVWSTSPVLEGVLGWYAVCGQALLTALVLIVLADLARILDRGGAVGVGRAVVWTVLLSAGAACFGSGMATAAVFPLVLWIAVPAERRSRAAIAALVLGAVAVLTVYVALRASAPLNDARAEELLAPGATFAALPDAMVMTAHLLGFGSATLFTGVFGRIASYPHPHAALPIGVVAVAVIGGWLAWPAARRRLAAFATLLVVVYAATAAGRASVLGTFDATVDAAATWQRYHYLALALLTALVCSGLAAWQARSRSAGHVVRALAAAAVVTRIAFAVATPLAIDHRDLERSQTHAALLAIHVEAQAVPPGKTAVLDARSFPPVLFVAGVTHAYFPGLAGLSAIFFPDNVVDGRPVRFTVSADDYARAQERGGRLAALVTPRP